MDRSKRGSNVKVAKDKRYQWPAPVAPEDAYVAKEKNPIHSILTALPILMLVAGLYFYYQGESEQNEGTPIFDQSELVSGTFTGLSVVKSGTVGRHYLWIDVDGSARGVRVRAEQAAGLNNLEKNSPIQADVAPTVIGSRVVWAWRIKQNDTVFLDMSESAQ